MCRVSALYIYPVKSLEGIAVNQAFMTSRGLQYDRRWMLVDQNHQFLSQRTHPQLALFRLSLLVDKIQITYADSTSVLIPFLIAEGEIMTVKIWDDQCNALRLDAKVDEWFTNKLGISCKLVYMPETTKRGIDLRYASADDVTSFADEYPTLLISQNSLDDLNTRLDQPVPMDRFRPNIVITAPEPYYEDQMFKFNLNNIIFSGVKLCARCKMTGVNQQNAVSGQEPLKTLATYRRLNNKIYFGQNLLHQGQGYIYVGQSLQHIQLRQSPSFFDVVSKSVS